MDPTLYHDVKTKKQEWEDRFNAWWTEVTSPAKFEEHIENLFDFNQNDYIHHYKKHNVTYVDDKVSKKQKTMHRMPIPMDVHAGPSTVTKRMGRSRYHNTLGTRYKRRCKKYVKEATEKSGNTNDKTLIVTPLVDVAYSADDHSDNTRNTYQAYVKGVKIKACFKIRPGQSTLTDPLTIRWAVLVPETNTGSTSDIAAADFFMTHETTTDEFADFPATGNYLEYHGRRINTSKYGIMNSGTFTLGPSSSGSDTYRHSGQTKLMNIWVPLKKVFQWNNLTVGTAGEDPTSNLHFVWWYTERGDLETDKQHQTASAGPIAYNIHKTTFFKNIHL